jgi:hypothetical protein
MARTISDIERNIRECMAEISKAEFELSQANAALRVATGLDTTHYESLARIALEKISFEKGKNLPALRAELEKAKSAM